jgi:ceramide glucosyltransferase
MLALGLLLGILALGYTLTAYLATQQPRNDGCPQPPPPLPPVTVLKPLCGAEPGLEQALDSLCGQCDSNVQIVFGVQDPADPALPIVRALCARYPRLDTAIIVDSSRHGHSAKVSNLINMMRAARHDYLVLADSDVHVPPGYLAGVCAPLADPTVGIVTCPYRGRPARTVGTAGLCSELGALFVNDWFMPSVRVASWLGSRAFAFGVTIALRRSVLEAIGGFTAIADQLADDYRLGELTRRRGLRTVRK